MCKKSGHSPSSARGRRSSKTVLITGGWITVVLSDLEVVTLVNKFAAERRRLVTLWEGINIRLKPFLAAFKVITVSIYRQCEGSRVLG